MPKGELTDPNRTARDVSDIGHWGNGDYEVIINDSEQINYLMTLIKQSLEHVRSTLNDKP
jgi:predicted transport protein